MMTSQPLQKVDHAELKANQIGILTMNILAFILDLPFLAVVAALGMGIGSALKIPAIGSVYRYLPKPGGWMKPDIPLRFMLAVGIILMGLAAWRLFNLVQLGGARNNLTALFSRTPGKPVIVYFTAPDCVPCKTVQRPAIEPVVKLPDENLQGAVINASERPGLAGVWGVMGVPTTFLPDSRGRARFVNNGLARAEKSIEQFQTL